MLLRAKHNIATYDLEFAEDATIQNLGEKILELTGVPISGQKLICSGRQLTKDMAVTLAEAGLKTGSKVMILGKKYDPEQEESYKEILELEKKCKNVERKMLEVSDEVMSRTRQYFEYLFLSQIEGISKGHLDRKLHTEALKNIEKKVRNSNEELLKLLESLDGINLTEDQKECKIKRKSVATNMNKAMDKTDDILEKLCSLMEHGVP